MKVSKKLRTNIDYIKTRFSDCGDMVSRTFKTGDGRFSVYIAYFDDLVNRDLIETQVIRGLMVDICLNTQAEADPYRLLQNALLTADYSEYTDLTAAADEILAGNTLLIADGCTTAAVISSKSVPTRGVNKPETEIAVQGPQDSFSESMRTNTVLIRRRIRDSALKCVQLRTGRRTKTDTAVMYIEGIADENIVNEVIRRLKSIDADSILDSGYIEQYIQDNKFSPFPQMQQTERPDKAAAELLEGRVAIVTDNSPFVILVPVVLMSFYQASEDYYQRWEIASFVRFLRICAGFLAFSLPGLYIAVTLHDPSMLPLDLMLHLAGARKGVPLPTMAEVTGMELSFEILREAGIRLPAAVGGTLGIVGGIIIGQAAVDAGLVSPMVVIVVAFTGICSFAIPNQSLVSAYRLIKYAMILMSGLLGIYGFSLAVICVFIHLTSLESFGIPYIFPFGRKGSGARQRFKDSIIRLPLEMQKGRPPFSPSKKGD